MKHAVCMLCGKPECTCIVILAIIAGESDKVREVLTPFPEHVCPLLPIGQELTPSSDETDT
uniref:Uncharacterized protein n=1 Tax=Amphimedon queenslandica TaxID=400682 RepID=A0A1X7VH16_AMPQE